MSASGSSRTDASRPRFAGLRAFGLRLVREPLVHFIALGALIFVGVSTARALERPTIKLDAGELNQLVEYWQLQAQRPPTPAELKAIIQERVDEEVMAREAQRLGMDRGDLIIRRRLAQKMAFASEDTASAKEPSQAALQDYYRRNTARYSAPARAAVRHIFFSADRGLDKARADAVAALAQAREGKPVAGDPSLLPRTYADVTLVDLARDYGPAFAKTVETAPLGVWEGPVQSGFGFHLIQVQSRADSQVSPFADVQSQVHDDDLADLRRDANAAVLKKLRARYRVEVAGVTP